MSAAVQAVELVRQLGRTGLGRPADWVLLADWFAGADVTGWEGSTVRG